MRRRTVDHEIEIKGIGLHSGKTVSLHIRPGRSGIVFTRDGVRINAVPENVTDTRLNTTVGAGGVSVSTIEHVMSALWGLSVTDCEIETDGPEMPVLDGSALPYCAAFREAGLRDLPAEVSPLSVHDTFRVGEGDSWIEAVPGPFSVFYEIEFPSRAIGRQSFTFDGTDYEARIAPARTFGMLRDVDRMREAGLALGGSLDNAVVVDEDRVVNPGGPRFPDECIRHKVLDVLGDLWTLGTPLEARINAYKASHRLHIALAKKIREAGRA